MALFKDCRGEDEHRLSMCVSCRPYPQRINTYDYCIDVVEENGEDITRFLGQNFNEWQDWTDAETLEKVREEILTRADGVFQWVILVVPRVVERREEDLAIILASIADFPKELDDLYHDMFKLLREGNARDRRAALRLFRWITFAARPLTLAELRHAVVVDADSKLDLVENCKHSAYWCKDDESMFKRLRRLSFGVVNLVGDVVQFDHESVRDYMLARGLSSLEGVQHADSTPNVRGRSEAILSRVCFRYLAADDIIEHSEELFRQTSGKEAKYGYERYRADNDLDRAKVDRGFLLGPYATDHCWEHAAIAEAEGYSVEYILEITEWPMCKIAYKWSMLLSQLVSSNLTLQHLAAYHGIASVFEHVLSRLQTPSWHGKSLSRPRSGLDHEDDRGRTPLWYAAAEGQQTAVKLLLESGLVDANSRDRKGQTPVWRAAHNGHTDVVSLLLKDERTDVNSRDKYGQTPLAIAAELDYQNVVRLFLKNERTDVNYKNQDGDSPLAIAARMGRTDVVRLFLKNERTDVNSRDQYCRTPLLIAVRTNYEDIVAQLLARTDIDCNAFDGSKSTPLFSAAALGHEDITKMLLDQKEVLIWTKNQYGGTPLYAAVLFGETQIVRLFLERNLVDVNSKAYSDNDETLLECAAQYGHASIVRSLLETGEIDMNVHNLDKPFAQEVAEGSEETIQLLLEMAKVNTKVEVKVYSPKEFSGTASEIAKRFKRWRILKLIRDYESQQVQRLELERNRFDATENERGDSRVDPPPADRDDGGEHIQGEEDAQYNWDRSESVYRDDDDQCSTLSLSDDESDLSLPDSLDLARARGCR